MNLKKLILATARSVAFVAAASASVATVTAVLAPAALAAEKAKFSQKVGKPLQEAQALMGQKNWKAALEKINEASAVSGKTAQEEAAINEYKVYCLAQLKDTAGAAKIMESMLAANQVPADQVQGKILTLSQIYFQQKDYPKSIQYAERYVKESGPNAEVIQQLAQAYYLKGDYQIASDYAQKLIKQAEQAKKPIEKDWLVLLMSSQFKLDNKPGITSTLETLLTHYPTPEYWKNIFKYVSNEASYSERETIEILRLKKVVGVIEPSEYIEMAELSIAMTNPGDAKAILEAGNTAGVLGQAKDKERETRLLNMAKNQAKEDLATIDASTKEAQAKPTGEMLAKIGAAYLGHGQYDKAITTLQAALAKGGVNSVDEANIRLGVAYFNLGKKQEAISAFQAVSSKSKLARLSRLWVIYIQGQGQAQQGQGKK
ncbi:MAG TPA: tetratricopeptide repeat protein [Cellvibrio sp.]|nr:tetratricopeptide repeat protein [Cellvibrio sp.]